MIFFEFTNNRYDIHYIFNRVKLLKKLFNKPTHQKNNLFVFYVTKFLIFSIFLLIIQKYFTILILIAQRFFNLCQNIFKEELNKFFLKINFEDNPGLINSIQF